MQYTMNGESELIVILPVAGSMDKGGTMVQSYLPVVLEYLSCTR